MEQGQRKSIIEKSILMIPLLLAFLWMSGLVFKAKSPATMQLSPSRLDSLVTALFVFIIVYAAILIYMFFRMNKAIKVPVETKIAKEPVKVKRAVKKRVKAPVQTKNAEKPVKPRKAAKKPAKAKKKR